MSTSYLSLFTINFLWWNSYHYIDFNMIQNNIHNIIATGIYLLSKFVQAIQFALGKRYINKQKKHVTKLNEHYVTGEKKTI